MALNARNLMRNDKANLQHQANQVMVSQPKFFIFVKIMYRGNKLSVCMCVCMCCMFMHMGTQVHRYTLKVCEYDMETEGQPQCDIAYAPPTLFLRQDP